MKKLVRNLLAFLRDILFRNNKHTIQYGLAKDLKRIGGMSFLPINKKESKESQFLKSLDLRDKTVYDVGAMEGIFTLFFARKVINGKVVAFEPNPRNYYMIKRNIAINNFDNVLLSNFAIGNNDETIDLEVPKYFSGQGSSLHKDLRQKNIYKVKVVSIDNLLKENKYPKPYFIKIDIEGFELPALEGMKVLLQNKKPQLFIEVHSFVSNNMNRIIDLLENYNYSIYHVERNIDQDGIRNFNIEDGHLFCE